MKVQTPGFRIGASFGVEFSPNGEYLGSVGKSVALWSVSSRKQIRTNSLLKDPAEMAFSPSGSAFAIKNTKGDLVVCETSTADPLAWYTAEDREEGAGPVFVDDAQLVDGTWSGKIRAWGTADLTPKVLWEAPSTMVTFVLPGRARELWLFGVSLRHGHADFEQGDQLLASEDPIGRDFEPAPKRWRFLRGGALSPSGERAALRHGAREHVLEIIDTETWETVVRRQITQGGSGHGLCWAPEGDYLVVVENGGFSFRSTADLSEVGWLPSKYPSDVVFSPSGRLLALADWNTGTVVVPWPDILVGLGGRE